MYGWTKMPPNFGQEPPAPVGAASIWAQGLIGQTGPWGLPEGCEKHSPVCSGLDANAFNKITGKTCPQGIEATRVLCSSGISSAARRQRITALRGAIAKAKLESWPLGARAQLDQSLAIEQGHLAVAESQEAAPQVPPPRLQTRYEREARDAFAKVPWWGWLLGGVVLVRALR